MLLLRSSAQLRQSAAPALSAVGRAQRSSVAAAQEVEGAAAALEGRPADWESAKPFSAIPGPKPYPVLGNLPRFMPVVGEYGKVDMYEMQKRLRQQYGDMVRVSKIPGKNDMLWVFDPKITEKMLRNEGKWPIRAGVHTLLHYRTVERKEKYEGAQGTVATQGKEWHDFRSKVNQPMMQRKSANQYYTAVDEVAEEFIGRMRELRDENNELPPDFINELYKWSLESITMVALDTRLGCMAANLPKDSEPQGMIDSVQVMFEGLYKLDLKPSLWRLTHIRTPMWRRLVKALDFMTDVAEKHVDEAIARKNENPNRQPSILDKLMAHDPRIAKVMASDMIVAGVDTTSHMTASLLFHLAKHPEVQKKLGEEVRNALPTTQSPVTEEAMDQMPYLKACVKESLRVFPIAMGNMRRAPTDLVLGEYQVPKDTDVMLCHMVMSRDEKNYPRPLSFEPERWLRGSGEARPAHPFATMPFGFGPRMCLGRRFAEMETYTLVAKIIRNFWLEYHYGDEITYAAKTLNTVTNPLKFRLTDH